jgi:hypothetical protein
VIALPTLGALANRQPAAAAPSRCELCGDSLETSHRHVLELAARGILCACRPCALLFLERRPGSRYRTVPERVVRDDAFAITTAEWASLGIPVGLAFFVRNSQTATSTASYPSPAGLVEAELEPRAWQAVLRASSVARGLLEDVEALLVRDQRGSQRLSCYLVPVSVAYELAGRLRAGWRGLTGGDDVQRDLVAFFAGLDERSNRLRRSDRPVAASEGSR